MTVLTVRSPRVPFSLSLAGICCIWAAWCSCSGWILSLGGHLSGWGHLALLPILLFLCWRWIRFTVTSRSSGFASSLRRLLRRFRKPLPFIYLLILTLSLISGLLYTPWSFDAATYRLPRLLYWWGANRWYWIGTLDHRLDFSSCGFEWQMLPLLELTHTDRFLFLLNWLPYMLVPSLTFFAARGLGLAPRSAWRWMWLLPSGYCFALQCSGIQNDGYSVNFLLAAVAYAILAFHCVRVEFLLMSILAGALLTGAKLSNVPLLLPLALILWPALRNMKLLQFKVLLVVATAILCSALPLVALSIRHTGDWAGDPEDQWEVKSRNSGTTLVANGLIALNDAAQPPVMPGAQRVRTLLDRINNRAAPFFAWLRTGTPRGANGLYVADMAYEGAAGLGFGLGVYTAFLIIATCLRRNRSGPAAARPIPTPWRLALWSAWIAYAIVLMKLATSHSARLAAPYYPLLFFSLLRLPAIARIESWRISGLLAAAAALSVLPTIILTPVRPLFPVQSLAEIHKPWADNIAAKYTLWAGLRDDLAPIRSAFPPGLQRLGYAGGFKDTSYGLWKPLGTRQIIELGLPLETKTPPPGDIDYAVVTEPGLQQRYHMDLTNWCAYTHATVVFSMDRNMTLDSHTAARLDAWYLVTFKRGQ